MSKGSNSSGDLETDFPAFGDRVAALVALGASLDAAVQAAAHLEVADAITLTAFADDEEDEEDEGDEVADLFTNTKGGDR